MGRIILIIHYYVLLHANMFGIMLYVGILLKLLGYYYVGCILLVFVLIMLLVEVRDTMCSILLTFDIVYIISNVVIIFLYSLLTFLFFS